MTQSIEQTDRKRILFVLYLSIFVAMLGIGVIAPIMPIYAATLGAGGMSMGLIYSMFAVSRTIFMPIAGRMSDRYDRKVFIVTGLTIYALASIGYIWSGSIPELMWVRFLHGIGSAMVIPISAALIGDLSPKGQEGRMMGSFQVALFLGFGFGPLLGGVVKDWVGTSEVFILMGGLTLIALCLIVFFLPAADPGLTIRKKESSTFSTLLKSDLFKGLLLFRFVNAIGRGAMIAFLPVLAANLQITPSQIGLLISINILLTGVLQHFFGKLADKICRPHLVIAGSFLAGISLLLIVVAQNSAHLFLVAIISGLGGGLAFPASGALATELGREHGMGNVMGFFNTGMSLGMIVGPVLSGWIMDLFGLSTVFIFVGAVGIVGCIGIGYLLYRGDAC